MPVNLLGMLSIHMKEKTREITDDDAQEEC